MAKFIVCPHCQGEGVVTNPEVVGNGYTQSDLEEMGEEFLDNLRDGVYNVTCPACNGQRVTTRKQHAAYLATSSRQREDRLLSLQESGIYPGHRDYF